MRPKPSLFVKKSRKKLRRPEVKEQDDESALGWTCVICQQCYPFGAYGIHHVLVDGSIFSACSICLKSPAFTARYQHYFKNKMLR